MSAQPTTARTTSSGKNQSIKLARDGKFHLTVSQFQDVVVNVPVMFSQAGLFLVAAQAPNGTMNVGLTDNFNVGDLKPIEDVNRLYGIKKIISGPETIKEKAENKMNLQHVVYRLVKQEALKDQIWVRSSLDTEFLRIQSSSRFLEDALDKVASFNDVHDSDRLIRRAICQMIQGCFEAQVDYLRTFVGESEKDKVPFGEFLLKFGVPAWFYNRFALQKFDHPRDKPMWTIFFRSSLEKSFTLTLEEANDPAIAQSLENFPGFAELSHYTNSIVVEQDDKEDASKSKFFVPPRGFEKDIIADIKPARLPTDMSKFKDMSMIWNMSRFGLLGVSNPNGDRVALWKELFDVNIEEKFSPADAMKETKRVAYDLYLKPSIPTVGKFMEKVGLPARLAKTVTDNRQNLFPTMEEWNTKYKVYEEVKIEGKEIPDRKWNVPRIRVPMEIGFVYDPTLGPTINQSEILELRRERSNCVSSMIRFDDGRDDYKDFESSAFFERTFVPPNKKKASSMPNSALTNTAMLLVKRIANHPQFAFMGDQVKIFLGSFISRKLMDLAAVEISNRLANYDEEIFFDDQAPPEEEDVPELANF